MRGEASRAACGPVHKLGRQPRQGLEGKARTGREHGRQEKRNVKNHEKGGRQKGGGRMNS